MKPLAHSHSSIKDYENCALAYYHKRILKDVPDVKGDAAIWGERVHKDFELRVTEGKPLPDHLQHFEPHLNKLLGLDTKCEWKLALNSELKPTEWFAPDAWLRCVIDLYARVRDNTAVIIDYKTGKRKDDFDQLKLCALMVFAHAPDVNEVRTAFFWTQAQAMDTATYWRAEANTLWTEVITKIKRIHRSVDSDNWPARPSGLCGWCGYQPKCNYARR